MKCHNQFSGKIKKSVTTFTPAEFAQGVVKVKAKGYRIEHMQFTPLTEKTNNIECYKELAAASELKAHCRYMVLLSKSRMMQD